MNRTDCFGFVLCFVFQHVFELSDQSSVRAGRVRPAANPAIVRQIWEMDDRRNQGSQRFVLLRHEMPPTAAKGSHWDLMLENRGVLLTWELPSVPPGPLPATFGQLGICRLPDHRIEYLEYEGPVSKDRGTVRRVDSGCYQLINDANEDALRVTARGRLYLIELQFSKEFFAQCDHPSLESGKVVSFIEHTDAGN